MEALIGLMTGLVCLSVPIFFAWWLGRSSNSRADRAVITDLTERLERVERELTELTRAVAANPSVLRRQDAPHRVPRDVAAVVPTPTAQGRDEVALADAPTPPASEAAPVASHASPMAAPGASASASQTVPVSTPPAVPTPTPPAGSASTPPVPTSTSPAGASDALPAVTSAVPVPDSGSVDQTPRAPVSAERVAVMLGGGVGALLLLLGVLFGLKAAAERGFLSPSFRIVMGLVGGTGLWAGGHFLREKTPRLSSTLAGTGAGVLFGTLFAASSLFHMISSATALAAVALVAAAAGAYAVKTEARPVAYVALVGALAAPLVLSTGSNQAVPFFAYLTLLTAGMAAVGHLRRWPDLLMATALGVAGEHLGWSFRFYEPSQATIGWSAALCLALPLVAVSVWPRPEEEDDARQTDHVGLWSAVTLSLLAMPWVIPVDAIAGGAPQSAWWSALGVCLLPLPIWAAARRRDQLAWAVGGTVVSGALLLGMVGWLADDLAEAAPLWCVSVLPLLLGTFITAGHRIARAVDPLAVVCSVLIFGMIGATDGASAWSAGALFVVMATTLGDGLLAQRSGRLPFTLGAVSFAMLPAAGTLLGPDGDVFWTSLQALMVLALMWTPLVVPRFEPSATARICAALAILGAYPSLHMAWREGFGPDNLGGLTLLVGLASLGASVWLVRKHQVSLASAVLGTWAIVTLGFLTATLPLQLDNEWLTIALALETAALAWGSHRLRHPIMWVTSVVLGVAISARLLLNPAALSYGDASGMVLLNWTLYTWGVPAVCLALAAYWIHERDRADPQRITTSVAGLLVVLAMLVGFGLVNVEVSHAFQDGGELALAEDGWVEGTVRSLSWAAYGIGLLFAGVRARVRLIRLVAFGFVLLGALKVFLVDLWALSGFARVISLLGLGGSLLLAAYLFERLVLREAPGTEEA
jgi:uncharacterized membrane protein